MKKGLWLVQILLLFERLCRILNTCFQDLVKNFLIRNSTFPAKNPSDDSSSYLNSTNWSLGAEHIGQTSGQTPSDTYPHTWHT